MQVQDIQPKQDYPEKAEQTAHIESKHKINAEEINAIVEAVKIFESPEADPLANYLSNQ